MDGLVAQDGVQVTRGDCSESARVIPSAGSLSLGAAALWLSASALAGVPQEVWIRTARLAPQEGGAPLQGAVIEVVPHGSGALVVALTDPDEPENLDVRAKRVVVLDSTGVVTASVGCSLGFSINFGRIDVSADGRIFIPQCDGAGSGIFGLDGARIATIAPFAGTFTHGVLAIANDFFVLSSNGAVRAFDTNGSLRFTNPAPPCGIGETVTGPVASDRGYFVYCERVVAVDSSEDEIIRTAYEYDRDGLLLQRFTRAPERSFNSGTQEQPSVLSGGGGRTLARRRSDQGTLYTYDGVELGSISGRPLGDDVYYGVESFQFVCRYERSYGTPAPSGTPLRNPAPRILQVSPRTGTALVDIDLLVTDEDSPTLEVRLLAMRAGVRSIGNAVRMGAFTAGGGFLGPNVPSGTIRRVTWDASADLGAGTGFENVSLMLLADDGRGLLHTLYLTLPANVPTMGDPALTISREPVSTGRLLELWLWLIARGDPEITVANGEVRGTAGPYAGQVLASDTATTALGRQFLFSRIGAREATTQEVARARVGSSPGIQAPAGGRNEIGFQVGTDNDHWMVPL